MLIITNKVDAQENTFYLGMNCFCRAASSEIKTALCYKWKYKSIMEKIFLNSAPKYKKKMEKNSTLGGHKNFVNYSKDSPTLFPFYTG